MNRLDQHLVATGAARSRTQAAGWIDAGEVSVNGRICTKASARVGESDQVEVAPAAADDYVSRAGHKLVGALEAFSDIEVEGKRCLDAGASTGGFTDVLLRRGALRVEAVDVGHGQLVDALRADERVGVHEGMNLRYMAPADIGGPVQLTVCDVSFISLTLVLPALARATRPGGDVVVMVKPQFEIGADRLGRTGVVTSEALRQEAVEKVRAAAAGCGLSVAGQVRSPLPGQDGNHEFFLWCRSGPRRSGL